MIDVDGTAKERPAPAPGARRDDDRHPGLIRMRVGVGIFVSSCERGQLNSNSARLRLASSSARGTGHPREHGFGSGLGSNLAQSRPRDFHLRRAAPSSPHLLQLLIAC